MPRASTSKGTCTACGVTRYLRGGGLCASCWWVANPEALERLREANRAAQKTRRSSSPDETMADLDRIEAEQRRNLPKWWATESRRVMRDAVDQDERWGDFRGLSVRLVRLCKHWRGEGVMG